MENSQGQTLNKEEKIEPKKTEIIINEQTQGMVARDNKELYRIIQTMMKGQAFPKTLNSMEKIVAAWQVAASLKLPPVVAIQNMAIINGSVCMWGQLPKALAEATGELEDFKLFHIDEKYNAISLENKNLASEVWAAVIQIKRKGRSTNEYSFSIKDAEAANLLKKPGPWKEYRKTMLTRRAIGNAIKFEFPDALMGVPVAEYDFHQAPDIKNVTPATEGGKADEINKKFNGKQEELPEQE